MCVDVIDLGKQEMEFHGEKRLVPRVRLVFETEGANGVRGLVSRTFTASLNNKARLSEFLGKWRGKPVVPGETLDLSKLLGVSCTLVISQQQRADGMGMYAGIDAVSRPTKKVVASGTYDPHAARAKIAEKASKQAGVGQGATGPRKVEGGDGRPGGADGQAVEDDVPF